MQELIRQAKRAYPKMVYTKGVNLKKATVTSKE
jgi:hypothetical protein